MKDIVQDKKRSRIHATKVPKSSEITRFHAKKKKEKNQTWKSWVKGILKEIE